jgi:hypothetical protein
VTATDGVAQKHEPWTETEFERKQRLIARANNLGIDGGRYYAGKHTEADTAAVNDRLDTEIKRAELLKQIRACFHLARNAATEGEATAALERANALLIKHNLTEDEVMRNAPAGARPVEEVDRDWIDLGAEPDVETWRHRLVQIVSLHNLCENIYSGSGMFVLGRRTNVLVTREMFMWIAPQIERLAQDEHTRMLYEASAAGRREFRDADGWCDNCQQWCTNPHKKAASFDGFLRELDGTQGPTSYLDEHGSKHCGTCRGWLRSMPRIVTDEDEFKAGFVRGMIDRIAQRLFEIRRQREQQGAVRALVLTSQQAIEAYKKREFPVLGAWNGERMATGHYSAYTRGHRRGDEVVLTGGQPLGNGRNGNGNGRHVLGDGS